MVNKAKNQGTAYETELRLMCQDYLGSGWDITRMADGGTLDEGDLLLRHLGTGYAFIIEAKNVSQMNIHNEVNKAVIAAKTKPTAVIWRRLKKQPGNERRTRVGPDIVALTVPEFLALLRAAVA